MLEECDPEPCTVSSAARCHVLINEAFLLVISVPYTRMIVVEAQIFWPHAAEYAALHGPGPVAQKRSFLICFPPAQAMSWMILHLWPRAGACVTLPILYADFV